MKRVSGDGGIDGPPPSRSAYHHPDSPQLGGKVGVVVTSHRQSQRRLVINLVQLGLILREELNDNIIQSIYLRTVINIRI